MWSSHCDLQFLWNEIFWSAHTCGISSSHTLPPRCSWLFKAFKLEPRIASPKYFARDLCFKVGWFYSASIVQVFLDRYKVWSALYLLAGQLDVVTHQFCLLISFFPQQIENLVFPMAIRFINIFFDFPFLTTFPWFLHFTISYIQN